MVSRRADPTPSSTQEQAPSQGGPEAATQEQQHTLRMWPQVASLPQPAATAPAAGDGAADAAARCGPSAEEEALALAVVAQSVYGPRVAAAVMSPARVMSVMLGVLPSTMPAKLMFVYQVRFNPPFGRVESICNAA